MIIVTGGAGFIGSCLVWRLNQEGHTDIIVVDEELTPETEANVRGKEVIDIIEKAKFLNEVKAGVFNEGIEAIFHFGACSSTLVDDENYVRENNFEYSRVLAEWALKNNVVFHYASSAATYGDGSLGYSDDRDKIKTLQPLNLYGRSKQWFDEWVLDEDLYDKVVGYKFFNVFGPNEYHKGPMKSLIAKSYDVVQKEGIMRLFKSYKDGYADGEQKRDFIYVKDALDVVWHFFTHPDKKGIYNVGTGCAHSWNELAEALFAACDKEVNIEYIDMPDYIKPRYQYFTEADLTNLKKSTYPCHFTPLKDSVKEYAEFLAAKKYL